MLMMMMRKIMTWVEPKSSKLVALLKVLKSRKAWIWVRAECKRASQDSTSARERPSAVSLQASAIGKTEKHKTSTTPKKWTVRSSLRSLFSNKKTAITKSLPLSVVSTTSASLTRWKRNRWLRCSLWHELLKVMVMCLRKIRTQIKCLTATKGSKWQEYIMNSNTTKDIICSHLTKT